MKIFFNTGGLAETNAYLLADMESRVGVIIDAPEGTTASLIAIAREHNIAVEYLLVTHGHWDHISDHAVVTEAFPKAKVLIHKLDEPKLMEPASVIYDLPYEIPPRKADGYLVDGEKVHVGRVTLAIMHTPGHAPGHVVLYGAEIGEHGTLFAGDLLMAGAVGRYDLPDGSESTLQDSLRHIMLLPDGVKVLSGHGPATTIGRERRNNHYLLQHGLTEQG
jgi:glyoxylase-like metal-dependent hydrolase (beta-lactamase superfamily II)